MHRFSTRFRADFHFLEPVNDQPYWRMSFERQKVKVNETSRGLSFDCAYLFQDASRSITRETRQASAILLKFVNDEIRRLFQIELWRKIGWMVCNVFVPELVPKTRIYIYQNKYTANREYDIYSSTIWSTSRNYPREIKRPIVYLPWQYLHATNNRFSKAWWGGRVERHHQRSELVALWRVSKERKTRGRQFCRARTQLRITRRNVARNRAELVPRPASSPTNFNRGAASLFAGS